MLKILGYPDCYSVAPGEKIAFKISLEEGSHFDAQAGARHPWRRQSARPGTKVPSHVNSAADGRHAGKPQRIDAGSCLRVENFPALASGPFTVFAMIWPTLPKRANQTLIAQWDAEAQSGFRVEITDGGQLAVAFGDRSGRVSELKSGKKMLERQWYSIAVSIDPATRMVTLDQRPLQPYAVIDDRAHASGHLGHAPKPVEAPLFMAGCPEGDGTIGRHFDGKIDGPLILSGVHSADRHDDFLRGVIEPSLFQHIIARWDFARETRSTKVIDVGPSRYHGRIVHLPARGMKGWNWTGEEHGWTRKPEHYGAIHFHHDDIYDAGWETSVEVTLPADLKSGAYALHVKCGENDRQATRENYIAFFVRPPRERRERQNRPKILVLAPTASYLAYANHAEHITARGAERQMGRLLQFGHIDLYMYEHPELGGSLYDAHADGSGVCYSSRLRPNPQLLAAISFLARRPRLGSLPIQCRHSSLRLARSQGSRLRSHHR